MVTIKQQLVSNPVAILRGVNGRKHIVVHETANFDRGAGAQRHANLQSNRYRTASWNYQVDDKLVIQSHRDTVRTMHAGDGLYGTGNNNGISIEICVNPDSDYRKAVENAAKLVKILMVRHNLPLSEVKQHNAFSGKNCPTLLRSGSRGINWNGFLALVSGSTASAPSSPRPSTSNTPTPSGNLGLVDWMNANKMDSKFSSRVALASQHGISGYKGTQAQNILLLSKLQGKAVVKPVSKPVAKSTPKPVAKPTPKPSSNLGLVDWMKASGMKSGFADRAKLFGSGYKGTQAQNVTLLNRLQNGPVSRPVAKPKESLVVDGHFGVATIRALQRYFGTPVDGMLSTPSVMVRALQKLLKVRQDGYMGPITIKALQRRLGTPADGFISAPSTMVRELQRRLNRGQL